MQPEDEAALSKLIFDLVPADGTRIGNVTLLPKFREAAKKKLKINATEEDYWTVRNALIGNGALDKGRGRGGSVYRLTNRQPKPKAKRGKKIREAALYPDVGQYIEKMWVKDNSINQFVLETTASQGKRKTGGKWTQPDLALVAVKSYAFIPGKVLDLVTFEVKPANEYRIEGVFETAAHSRFSHKSYLIIYMPDGDPETDEFDRVLRECERFGLGLVTFTKPDDPSSYETLQEAERRNPDPSDVNGFVSSQISQANQARILEMVK